MKVIISLTLVVLVFPIHVAYSRRPATRRPIVIHHVTVIDMTGAPPKPDMTVVITGERISAIGVTGHVRFPRNSDQIDANPANDALALTLKVAPAPPIPPILRVRKARMDFFDTIETRLDG